MLDDAVVEWEGFSATIGGLKSLGWIFSSKPSWGNWRKNKRIYHYIYLRHPILKMVGRFRKKFDDDSKIYTLDFLTLEKTQRIKPPKFIEQRDYTPDDILPMLKTISQIQETAYGKRKVKLPEADILEFAMRA